MEARKKTSPRIIAVDGPAGSGKSSICSRVAQKLGWSYLNTGAIYRGMAALANKSGIVDDDELSRLAEVFCRDSRWDGTTQKLYFSDVDITSDLYTPVTSTGASKIAKNESLRKILLPLQRTWALSAEDVCLVDGRDIGTVVFPDAALKIFMTASLEERARRRIFQMSRGQDEFFKDLQSIPEDLVTSMMSEISSRDEQDSSRGIAPLKRADDALLFDTTGLTADQSVQEFVKLLTKVDFLNRNF